MTEEEWELLLVQEDKLAQENEKLRRLCGRQQDQIEKMANRLEKSEQIIKLLHFLIDE